MKLNNFSLFVKSFQVQDFFHVLFSDRDEHQSRFISMIHPDPYHRIRFKCAFQSQSLILNYNKSHWQVIRYVWYWKFSTHNCLSSYVELPYEMARDEVKTSNGMKSQYFPSLERNYST